MPSLPERRSYLARMPAFPGVSSILSTSIGSPRAMTSCFPVLFLSDRKRGCAEPFLCLGRSRTTGCRILRPGGGRERRVVQFCPSLPGRGSSFRLCEGPCGAAGRACPAASWLLLAVGVPGFAGFAPTSVANLSLRPCVLLLRPATLLATSDDRGGRGPSACVVVSVLSGSSVLRPRIALRGAMRSCPAGVALPMPPPFC